MLRHLKSADIVVLIRQTDVNLRNIEVSGLFVQIVLSYSEK